MIDALGALYELQLIDLEIGSIRGRLENAGEQIDIMLSQANLALEEGDNLFANKAQEMVESLRAEEKELEFELRVRLDEKVRKERHVRPDHRLLYLALKEKERGRVVRAIVENRCGFCSEYVEKEQMRRLDNAGLLPCENCGMLIAAATEEACIPYLT